MGYNSKTQTEKNLAWFLPRPRRNKYKGGMPLYAEEWLTQLAKDILDKDVINLLNLFSGGNQYGIKVDSKEEVNPDYVYDAHKISDLFKDSAKFDVILADPPYSEEESRELYETGALNYKKWTKECDEILKVDGLLIVYHKYVMPNPNPEKYKVEKRVFIGNRSRHLPRVAIYFRKTS